ncbi:uncharacterized protein LOC135200728 [Macrobrachium nipponense]|uniref:uncharacterized protein LOC135200728 n=1 Tax=Macrobrachium nipponense TaxID=159736 RepID=UPI0030C83E59
MVLRLHHRSVVNSYACKFIPVAVAVILIFFVIVHDDAEMKDPSRNNQRGSSVIPKSRMRDRHDGAPSDDVRKYSLCKALFSLDSPVSEEKIEAIYSGMIRPNGDVFHRKEDAKGREEVKDIYRKIDGVLSKIRKLKYSEPEHFSGEDYQPLAELLPSVAEYDSASDFRTFLNSPEVRRDLPEIRQLKKWANYEETPPDLLIIDYTAWVLTLHTDETVIPQAARHTTDVLDALLELHAKVVPLLDKISKRTRVLVLSQSRLKLDVENLLMNYRGAMADFNMDWSEGTFLYLLKHYHHLNLRPLLESRRAKAKEILRISEDYVKDYKAWESQSADMNSSAIWNFFQGAKKAENESSSSSNLSYSAQLENGSPGSDAEIFSRYPRVAREKLKKTAETTPFRDYLIPSTEDSGLWFWDALIPLTLAEIRECHEMIDERGYADQPFYKGTARRCYDPVHSGDITNSDLVTMMLNLLCNTVLEAEGDYCCS